ncbi:MAG: phosphatidylglycerophosphatase A, partial [Methanomicrobiales archaeon]|nr:phosphatidylglycerophosphatase A [Methanomicrobiales archaeon]
LGVGMLIAGMIGGTPAQRAFARYDRDHPAMISGYGPVLDDAVAGLVAGCTARCGGECQ